MSPIAEDTIRLGGPCRFVFQLARRNSLENNRNFGLKKCEFDQTKPLFINSNENSINNPSVSEIDDNLRFYLRNNSKILANNQFQHQNHQHLHQTPLNSFHLKIIKIIYVLYSIMLFCNLLTIVYLNFELFSLEKIFGLTIKINGTLLIIFLLAIIGVLCLLNILLLINKSLKAKRNGKQIEFANKNVNIYDVFTINVDFASKENRMDVRKEIAEIFQTVINYLNTKQFKFKIPMHVAFVRKVEEDIKVEKAQESLYPLYMALATYQKFLDNGQWRYSKENEVPIKLILLYRAIKNVDLGSQSEQKGKSEQKEKKVEFLGYRLNIFKNLNASNITKDFKFETENSNILNGFNLTLDFSEIKNLKERAEDINEPFKSITTNIDKTYDDIPINEQAGIFIGLNVLEYFIRIIEKKGKKKEVNGETQEGVLLPSGLGKHQFKVIKVSKLESLVPQPIKDDIKVEVKGDIEKEENEQIPKSSDAEAKKEEDAETEKEYGEQIKGGADYETQDIVVEVKSHQPEKSKEEKVPTLVRWIGDGLKKAEKQVAISLKMSEDQKEDEKKNFGFVVSLYNPNSNTDKEWKPLYLVIELLVLNPNIGKVKKKEIEK